MPHTSTFLVDDSPSFLQSAARFLASDERIEVVGIALSASEALREVARIQPALVLIDLNMPGMSGLEATRQLKALPNPPRVVVLTLHDTQEYRLAAEQAQADGFVAKSDFGQKLLPLLESFLQEGALESGRGAASGSTKIEAAAPTPAPENLEAKGAGAGRAPGELGEAPCGMPQVLGRRLEAGSEEQAIRAVLREKLGARATGGGRHLPLPWTGRLSYNPLLAARSAPAESHRVLLAEDRVDVSHLMAVNMWRAGIETRIACDALTALELFDSFDPHLVLLSATSPYLKAPSVCRSIREHSGVPILLVVNSVSAVAQDGASGLAAPTSGGAHRTRREYECSLPDVEVIVSCPGDVSHMTARVLSLLSRFYPGAL